MIGIVGAIHHHFELVVLAISVFGQALLINMSFWRCSEDNIANDTLLCKLHLSLAHPLSGLAS